MKKYENILIDGLIEMFKYEGRDINFISNKEAIVMHMREISDEHKGKEKYNK
jgi:hypothetical protein